MRIFGREIVWSTPKHAPPPPSKRMNMSYRQNGSTNSIKRVYHKARKNKRAYESAKNTRFMANWSTSPSPINYQITSVLHTLVARSRDAYQNNDYIRRAVSLRKSKVVGHTGIRWIPRVKTNGKIDPKINDQLHYFMKQVSKVGVLDVKGRLSYIDIQNRVEQQVFIDGEYICIFRYGKQFKFGFAIDEIDPMLLPVDMNIDLKNGNIIRCGIELNKDKKPVAYHFIKDTNHSHPHLNPYSFRSNTQRIKAEYVVHYYHQEFPDQLRGIPKIATSLFRIEVLRKYIEAELIGARLGSSSAGFFVRQKDYTEPYDGTGDIDINDPEEEDIYANDLDDEELDEVEAGSVKIAPLGYDFKAWDLNRPNSAFGDFVKENTRAMASSVDINYSALSNNYENVSFSSLRDSKLVDEEIEKQGQVFLIEHFLERVVPTAIITAIDFGFFVIKDRRRRITTDYIIGVFVPKVSKWVDPVKTAQAYRVLNRDLGVMSRERICGELDILDPTAEFETIKLEELNYPLHNSQDVPSATSDKETEEDNEQKETKDNKDED